MSYNYASGSSSILTRNSGTLGHISMAWVKYLEYTTGGYCWFFVSGTADDWGAANGHIDGGSDGDLTVFTINTTGNIISSGSNTAWIFICIVETFGVGITAYYRFEGDTSLGSVSVANTSNFDPGILFLGDNAGRPANNHRITAYKEWQNSSSLTTTQIMDESTQNTPINTTDLTNYLQCNAGNTVGTDQSALSQNWTVAGTTITINADEPNMSIGPVGTAIPTYSSYVTA